jgi:hypothetical protein
LAKNIKPFVKMFDPDASPVKEERNEDGGDSKE